MSKQLHFVVQYDTETGYFTVENETTHIQPGNVWDTDANAWSNHMDSDEDYAAFIAKEDELVDILLAYTITAKEAQ